MCSHARSECCRKVVTKLATKFVLVLLVATAVLLAAWAVLGPIVVLMALMLNGG